MKHLDLFSGIGGFALAARWMGWETIQFVEIDNFCQRVLNKHWPNVPIHGDIKTFNLELLWKKFVQNVKNDHVLQGGHIVNHATPNELHNGEVKTRINTEQINENGVKEKRKKLLTITEEDVFVVENLRWNFSQLTINKIMEMQSEESINLKHGNLLLNVDSLMTTKSSVTIATMQKLIMEFVHTLKKIKPDVITAGVPCQPASTAGKRKGKEDHRWLWPETFRVIREFCPRFVILENVYGLISLEGGVVFDSLLASLEDEGYQVAPVILPACAVNAPHRRDRIWFVAYSIVARLGIRRISGRNEKEHTKVTNFNEGGTFTYSKCIGQQGQGRSERQISTTEDGNWKASWSYDDGRWPTQSPICGRNDGVSNRVDRIKSLGNAIVPQVAFEIFKAIQQSKMIVQ